MSSHLLNTAGIHKNIDFNPRFNLRYMVSHLWSMAIDPLPKAYSVQVLVSHPASWRMFIPIYL